MDQDGTVKIKSEVIRSLMRVAKDLSDMTGAYVSVSEIANQLLAEKLQSMFQAEPRSASARQETVSLQRDERKADTESIGGIEVESIYKEASRLSAELLNFQQFTPSVGPTQGSIQEQFFSPPHAPHAPGGGASQVDPTKDSSEPGRADESKKVWPRAYVESGNPPGFYPGFPAGLTALAAADPFIPSAPSADYTPIYTIQTAESGNRYISFHGWQPHVIKEHGNVYVTDANGNKKRVAYQSNRLFPERMGKKRTIPGTNATVSDGSDGDTAIILGQD